MARHDAPFLIKRLAPMMGHPTGPRRVSVSGHAYTLEGAVEAAREEQARATRHRWLEAYWVERRGQPATRRAR